MTTFGTTAAWPEKVPGNTSPRHTPRPLTSKSRLQYLLISVQISVILAPAQNQMPTEPLPVILPRHAPGGQRKVDTMAATTTLISIPHEDARRTKTEFRSDDYRHSHLTNRELEVLKCIAEGYSTKQTATILGMAVKTAACHRYRLMGKLGVHDSVSLVRYAIRNGIIQA